MPDEDEQVEVVKVPLSTAVNMVLQGEIRDAKTIIALSLVSTSGGGSINQLSFA